MIIAGPISPGKDVNIYLQPLIKEFKHLQETGIETYDSTTKHISHGGRIVMDNYRLSSLCYVIRMEH